MMRTLQERQFRIPIDELRMVLKKQHGVDLAGVEPFIDGDQLVFSVVEGSALRPREEEVALASREKPELPSIHARRRHRRRRRNRIKTRGWKVVGRIMNSQGLTANVYEPFVQALKDIEGTRAEQRALVRRIMERNGNSPTADSIDYYLDNTLEYFRRQRGSTGANP